MSVALGADHAGYALKQELVAALRDLAISNRQLLVKFDRQPRPSEA